MAENDPIHDFVANQIVDLHVGLIWNVCSVTQESPNDKRVEQP